MNRRKTFQLVTFIGLPLLAFSNLSQAARIGYHGMFCQPRDAATPFKRDPAAGIVNPSLDTSTTTATYDCPVPVDSSATTPSIKSARVTVIEDSIGNLDCMLMTKSTTGATLTAQQRVAPVGASPTPYVFNYGSMPLAVDGHALMTCRVPPHNLGTASVPSSVISYSITQ